MDEVEESKGGGTCCSSMVEIGFSRVVGSRSDGVEI